jgi:hypothetical protein
MSDFPEKHGLFQGRDFPPPSWYLYGNYQYSLMGPAIEMIKDIEDYRLLTYDLSCFTPEEQLKCKIEALFFVFGSRIVDSCSTKCRKALERPRLVLEM